MNYQYLYGKTVYGWWKVSYFTVWGAIIEKKNSLWHANVKSHLPIQCSTCLVPATWITITFFISCFLVFIQISCFYSVNLKLSLQKKNSVYWVHLCATNRFNFPVVVFFFLSLFQWGTKPMVAQEMVNEQVCLRLQTMTTTVTSLGNSICIDHWVAHGMKKKGLDPLFKSKAI